MGRETFRGALKYEDDPNQSTSYMPFFMVYGFEAILLTDLDYGAPRVRTYDK